MASLGSPINAYAYRSGEIGFCEGRAPDGAIKFARAPRRVLREAVSAYARHAYDGKTLLVPGIPEARNEDTALQALVRFRRHILARVTSLREEAVAHG